MENETMSTPRQGGVSPLLVILSVSGLIGLVTAGVMLLASGPNATSTGSAPPTPVVIDSRQAADFQLVSLDGEMVNLADFQGRPVFINLWRTDCPPCVRELPAFQQFMREQGDDGAVVLAINQGEELGFIRDFLAEIGINGVPVLLDPDLDVAADYSYRGLPTTYLIDSTGTVRFRKVGEMTLAEMNTYVEAAES